MATVQEMNKVYQEELGRNIDSSGADTYKDLTLDELRATLKGSEEASLRKARLEGKGTEATWDSFSQWYREELELTQSFEVNREFFDSMLDQGFSLEEMQLHARGQQQYKLDKYIYGPIQRGKDWYAGGGSIDEEFGATSSGQYVILKEGQDVGEEYTDITDELKGYVPEGYRAYVDEGESEGFRGWSADTLGISENAVDWVGSLASMSPWGLAIAIDPDSKNAKVGAGWYGGGIADRFWYGESGRKGGRERMAEHTGLQEEEVTTYTDLAATVTSGILAAVFPVLWWLPAAVTASQGASKKVGGTRAEREEDWSTIAENTAWDLVIGYAGKVGNASKAAKAANTAKAAGDTAKAAKALQTARAARLAQATAQAARTKAQGGNWEDAAVRIVTAASGNYVNTGSRGWNAIINAGVAGGGAYISANEDESEAALKAAAYSGASSYAAWYMQDKGYSDASVALTQKSIGAIQGLDARYTERIQQKRKAAEQANQTVQSTTSTAAGSPVVTYTTTGTSGSSSAGVTRTPVGWIGAGV